MATLCSVIPSSRGQASPSATLRGLHCWGTYSIQAVRSLILSTGYEVFSSSPSSTLDPQLLRGNPGLMFVCSWPWAHDPACSACHICMSSSFTTSRHSSKSASVNLRRRLFGSSPLNAIFQGTTPAPLVRPGCSLLPRARVSASFSLSGLKRPWAASSCAAATFWVRSWRSSLALALSDPSGFHDAPLPRRYRMDRRPHVAV
jgi:hypothetical protein